MGGRLNREENPMPGEKPGFTPQHEKENGGFANTGERNPLPVEVKNQQGTQTIEGEVDVGNWPTSQVIEGSVKVDNIPDVQKVSGSVDVEFPESQEVRDTDVKERLDSMEEKFTELLDKTNELIGKTADRLDGTIDTRLTGSKVQDLITDDGMIPVNGRLKTSIETIIEAEPLKKDEKISAKMGIDGTEMEVWIWVNINVDDWKLSTNYVEYPSGWTSAVVYPRLGGDEAYPQTWSPIKTFFYGVSQKDPYGKPESLEDAKKMTFYFPDAVVQMKNYHDDEATVTVRVIRTWGDK